MTSSSLITFFENSRKLNDLEPFKPNCLEVAEDRPRVKEIFELDPDGEGKIRCIPLR